MARKRSATPNHHTSQLIEAAKFGGFRDVILKLKNTEDVDVNYPDHRSGRTALHFAAAYNSYPTVRALVATGKCDFSINDDTGRTAAALAFEVADNPALGRYLYDKEFEQKKRKAADANAKRRQRQPKKAQIPEIAIPLRRKSKLPSKD
jgi:ankyrin repeat protein